MATRSKVKQLACELIKNLPTLTKPRIDLIALFILSIVKVSTVNLSKIAIAMDTACKTQSNYRRLQRFISEVDFSPKLIIPLIIKWIRTEEENYTLLIDRTNWEFGQKKINILMVSVLHNGYSIPLGWSLLDKKGNSNQGERIDLINEIIEVIGPDKIKSIIGDREFGGPYWIKCLEDKGIDPIIRIRDNQKVYYKGKKISVKSIIRSNSRKGKQSNNRIYTYNNMGVYISGFRFRNDKNKLEYLIIMSQKPVKNIPEIYGQRWQIESMFKNMKSNGFNLQETHLQEEDRLKRLVGLVSVAYTWMVKTGLMILKKSPEIFKCKKHGRPSKGIFRAGLEFIMRAVFTNNDRDFSRAIKFLSCT
jgi:hypothetical protein